MSSCEKQENPASTTICSAVSAEVKTWSAEPRSYCRKHGVPLEFQEYASKIFSDGRWYCPACDEENERAAAAEEARGLREKIVRGIPPHYQDADLSQFDAAQIAPVLKWASAPSGFLYIHGTCGVGKTHLVCAVQKKLNIEGRYSMFVNAVEMFAHIHRSFNPKLNTSEDAIVDRYAPKFGKNIAIFDDVGVQKVSEFTENEWYKIIDRRDRQDCPTLITTNFKPKELEPRLGDRVTSRMSSGVVVELEGPDRRLVGKKSWTAKFD